MFIPESIVCVLLAAILATTGFTLKKVICMDERLTKIEIRCEYHQQGKTK